MSADMDELPTWFKLNEELMWSLIGMGLASTRKAAFSSYDLEQIGYLALLHHAGCLEAGIEANKNGKHSAAMCLVRQSVESLSVVEISLQEPSFAEPLLDGWKNGKKSHGLLRKELEEHIWPKYGTGLWRESWAMFYGNLAKSIQPYAHYTTELQGWQLLLVEYDGGKQYTAMAGLQTYDPIKATRITLFHALLTWMLGRILIAKGDNQDVLNVQQQITALGKAIGKSKLLFQSTEWWKQLTPDMLFMPGHSWRDNT